MESSQNINLKALREYVERLTNERDLVKSRIDDIAQEAIERAMKAPNGPLSERQQRKEDIYIETTRVENLTLQQQLKELDRKIFLAKTVLEKELTFRKDVALTEDELAVVQGKVTEYENALADLKNPLVQGDDAQRDKVMKRLEKAYRDLTGESFDPAKFDEDALGAKVKHVSDKAQQKLDSLFGNVDEVEVTDDRKELEKAEKGIAEIKERQKDYSDIRKLLAGDMTKDPDLKNKITEYKKLETELTKLTDKNKELADRIAKLKEEIDKITKELAEKNKKKQQLENKNPRTPEEEKQLQALMKEISSLEGNLKGKNGELAQANGELSKVELDLNDAQANLASLANDLGDYLKLVGLIEKLGIMDGDKPFELTGDLDVATKVVGKSSRGERLATKKKELQEKATLILDKYGAEVPKKGDFAHALDERVTEIKKNYNKAHVQAGWTRSDRSRTPPEPEPVPTTPGEPTAPGETTAPGGTGGTTGTPTGGNGRPSTGGIETSGSSTGGTYRAGSFTGGPAPTTPGTVTPTPEQGDNVTRDIEAELNPAVFVPLAYEKLGDPIKGDVNLRTLVDKPGMTKVENGYVYRVVPMVPEKGTENDREYQPIREPVDYYFEDTSSKLKSGIRDMIESIREMDKDERDDVVKKLSPTQQKQMEKILKGGIFRGRNERKFIKEILKRDPKTQVDLLIAYNSSAGLPELMAQATGFLDGNPYQKPTDLIIQTEKPKGLFKRLRKDKIKPLILEKNVENLIEAYSSTEKAPTTRREEPRRDHTRTKEQDSYDR